MPTERPARTDQKKAPRTDPPPMETYTTPGGIEKVRNPSPLRMMKKDERRRYMLGVLEYAAAHGSVDAAKAVLAHERWIEEMKDGRPPLRGKVDLGHSVTLVDDIAQPGSAHQPTRRLPPQEAKAHTVLPAPQEKPAVPPTSDKD